ncbi:hypothetical protein FRC19_004895 [Serendipita sp. 401]|nr:hypothetical protein FRC19_004895 [Serendipita sp. 401]
MFGPASAGTNTVRFPKACTRLTSTLLAFISLANGSSISLSAAALMRIASASAAAANLVASACAWALIARASAAAFAAATTA